MRSKDYPPSGDIALCDDTSLSIAHCSDSDHCSDSEVPDPSFQARGVWRRGNRPPCASGGLNTLTILRGLVR
jgi:hypothetical protein